MNCYKYILLTIHLLSASTAVFCFTNCLFENSPIGAHITSAGYVANSIDELKEIDPTFKEVMEREWQTPSYTDALSRLLQTKHGRAVNSLMQHDRDFFNAVIDALKSHKKNIKKQLSRESFFLRKFESESLGEQVWKRNGFVDYVVFLPWIALDAVIRSKNQPTQEEQEQIAYAKKRINDLEKEIDRAEEIIVTIRHKKLELEEHQKALRLKVMPFVGVGIVVKTVIVGYALVKTGKLHLS